MQLNDQKPPPTQELSKPPAPDRAGEPAKAAPWKGRKRSSGDEKGKRFEFRISQADLVELERRAQSAGLTAGAYIRKLAVGSAGPRHKKRATVNNEAVAKLLFEIGKIGGNVNQLAKWANTEKRLAPSHASIKAMQRELAAMRDQLTEALGYDNQR